MNPDLILCPECGKHTKDAETCDFCLRPISQEWRDEQSQSRNESHHMPAPAYGGPALEWMEARQTRKREEKGVLWLLLFGVILFGIALVVYLT